MVDFKSLNNIRRHTSPWKTCERCSIASKHKVFFRGSWPCKYLFIGEAPGPSEKVTKRPFTGTSGKILNHLIRETEMTSFGITNTICCFPFQKDRPTKFRPPLKEELENCRERLDDLTEGVTASYYIALGQVAKQNPPTGCKYSLVLDHPSFIARKGGYGTVEYKRNKHKLMKFLEETRDDK